MDPLTIVLGGLAGVGLAGAAWLLIERSKGTAAVGAATAQRDAAAAEARKAEQATAEMRRELEHARGETASAREDVATLRQQIESEREAALAEQRRIEDLAQNKLEAAHRIAQEQLASEKRARDELAKQLAEFEGRVQKTLGVLTNEALKSSTTEFLKLAEQRFATGRQEAEASLEKRRAAFEELVRPIGETLKKTDEKLAAMEKERVSAYAGLRQQVEQNAQVQAELRAETGRLVKALREPHVRGRYGEVQLRRVAELAGMSPHCDFAEQGHTRDDEGNPLRPDMIVNLPTGRQLAIDAKTNIQAYIEAIEAPTPDAAEACLERFARHVSEQATALGKKGYWRGLDASPEFVVMFVPGDQFIDAALTRRPDLFEKAAASNVILASPSSLIGLLRAVAVGWREKKIEEQARELFDLGRQLHERAAVVSEHLGRLGNALEQAVKRYNDAIGSYESRLVPTLRKFEEAGASSAKALEAPAEVTVRPRLTLGLGSGSGSGGSDEERAGASAAG